MESRLNCRTIREFDGRPVDRATVDDLLAVANRTATSNGMQAFSIVRITNDGVRRAIADVCRQPYVARAPELWIFIVDQYRNARIAAEQGDLPPGVLSSGAGDMDRFFQGFTDAVLAAQRVATAAEDMGLGAVFLGSILNDAGRIVEILRLPKLTFPALGLGMGRPGQSPQLKPRMDRALKVFENEYRPLERYLPAIADYDREMETYYDLRDEGRRSDCFSLQVARRLAGRQDKRAQMLRAVRAQGFDPDVD
ncbi:MAG: NADPH-dependent oxidoreductase [Clostridiales bacterium]|nr:NADPH-dependent oxidoreductase [Clostridiales bacterium]